MYWVFLACGVLAVVTAFALRSAVTGVAGVAALGVALYGLWVQRGPHPHRAWSPELVRPGTAVVFWKDGCPYAHGLLRALVGDGRIVGVNVYRDRAVDALVRRHNDRNRLAPTVLVGDRVLSNPSAEDVRAALGSG